MTISLIMNLIFLALIVTAAKRCKQYKSIINRVAPTDPVYLQMLTEKQKRQVTK